MTNIPTGWESTDSPDPKCLDDHGQHDCAGVTEYRYALSNTGRHLPRCDHHWNLRLDEQERNSSRYPDSNMAPSWFDPTYAGERWNEED